MKLNVCFPKHLLFIFIWFLIISCNSKSNQISKNIPQINQPQEYASYVLYVDNQHVNSSDNNLGTDEEKPLKTIQKAIDLVERQGRTERSHDTIYVKEGEYRESIIINYKREFSTNNNKKVKSELHIKTYPGHEGKVYVKGSEKLDNARKLESNAQIYLYNLDKIFKDQIHRKIQIDTLDYDINVFYLDRLGKQYMDTVKNANENKFIYSKLDKAASDSFFADQKINGKVVFDHFLKDKSYKKRYYILNDQLFVNNKLLKEMFTKDKMFPGTFCIELNDAGEKVLFLWLKDGSNPNDHKIELSVRDVILYLTRNSENVTISGFKFYHSNNAPWRLTPNCYDNMGAVCISGAHNTFNNNEVNFMNGGGAGVHQQDIPTGTTINFIPTGVIKANAAGFEDITIKNNRFLNSGHLGFSIGTHGKNVKFINNELMNNCWRTPISGYQHGGMKIINRLIEDIVIKNNVFGFNKEHGLWLDGVGPNFTIVDNDIFANMGAGIEIECGICGINNINNNDISYNHIGIWVNGASNLNIFENDILYNAIAISINPDNVSCKCCGQNVNIIKNKIKWNWKTNIHYTNDYSISWNKFDNNYYLSSIPGNHKYLEDVWWTSIKYLEKQISSWKDSIPPLTSLINPIHPKPPIKVIPMAVLGFDINNFNDITLVNRLKDWQKYNQDLNSKEDLQY